MVIIVEITRASKISRHPRDCCSMDIAHRCSSGITWYSYKHLIMKEMGYIHVVWSNLI